MSMFAAPREGASGPNRHIVEYKAGRSVLQPGDGPTKRKVVAEPAKGIFYVMQTTDGLLHFCWKSRETGLVTDDLIIFPNDGEFKLLPGCPDGQVYYLKLKSSKEMRFYWIQDPVTDKDIIKKVNDAMTKPSASSRLPARGGVTELNLPNLDSALAEFYGNDDMDHDQLLELLGAAGSEGSEPNDTAIMDAGYMPSSTTPNNAADPRSTLQQLVAGLKPLSESEEAGQPSVDLADVICGRKAAETACNNEDRLVEHLPVSEDPKHEVFATVHSPQFRQAARSFGHALQTGQMGPVIDQFGVSADTKKAVEIGNVLEFAKKLTEDEQNAAKVVVEEGARSSVKEKTDEDAVKEPEPKRGKPDDDLD